MPHWAPSLQTHAMDKDVRLPEPLRGGQLPLELWGWPASAESDTVPELLRRRTAQWRVLRPRRSSTCWSEVASPSRSCCRRARCAADRRHPSSTVPGPRRFRRRASGCRWASVRRRRWSAAVSPRRWPPQPSLPRRRRRSAAGRRTARRWRGFDRRRRRLRAR